MEVARRRLGHFGDDAGGVGGVVAADVEEVLDVVLLEGLEDLLAVGLVGLVAGGAQGGGGGLGDALEQVGGEVIEGDEVVVDDAADAVLGAEDFADLARLLGGGEGFDDADEGLVDDGGGAAGLADDCVACRRVTLHMRGDWGERFHDNGPCPKRKSRKHVRTSRRLLRGRRPVHGHCTGRPLLA